MASADAGGAVLVDAFGAQLRVGVLVSEYIFLVILGVTASRGSHCSVFSRAAIVSVPERRGAVRRHKPQIHAGRILYS